MAEDIVTWRTVAPDDWRDGLSDSSSADSFDIYKNMQRVPDVPMPKFKKLNRHKIFPRKSPSILRIRRSAIMKALGDHKELIASTPVIHPSAGVDSPGNSLLQLSPITGASNGTHENENLNATKTDKLIKHNNSDDNLNSSKKVVRKKYVSASIKSTTEHLRMLSDSFRQENDEQHKQKKDRSKKNGCITKNVSSSTSMIENKKQIVKEKNKQILNHSEHNLTGIAELNLSSKNEVTNRAKPVESCKLSQLPTRRTVLMERQTQTTDSLEKLFKKGSEFKKVSPLKEKGERNVKRKILEEVTNGLKKSKTVVNQVSEDKQNNNANKVNKPAAVQSSTSSLEGERQEQESQNEVFHSSTQNHLPLHNVTVRDTSERQINNLPLYKNAEDALMEQFLISFDSKIDAESIVSISSTNESTQDKNLNNTANNTLLDSALSESIGQSKENNIVRDATIVVDRENSFQKRKDLSKMKNSQNISQKNREKSQILNIVNVNKVTGDKKVEVLKSNVTQGNTTKSKELNAVVNNSGTLHTTVTTEKSKVKPNQTDKIPRKRGRPAGTKSKRPSISVNNRRSSIDLPQQKRRGRPKGSKTKNKVAPTIVGRLSGFIHIQPASPVQPSDEENYSVENSRKRHRVAPKRFIQAVYIRTDKKPKKSMARISTRQSKLTKKHTPSTNIEGLESDDGDEPCSSKSLKPTRDESIPPNNHEPRTSKSINISSEYKSKKSSNNKSTTDNSNNLENVFENRETSAAVINLTSQEISISQTSINNKGNSKDKTQSMKTRSQRKKSQNIQNSLEIRNVECDNMVGPSTDILENINSENDSGINSALSKEVYIAPTSVAVLENISNQQSSAGSQKAKGSRKKSVTFIEPPLGVSQQIRNPQTLFPPNTETNPNMEIDSQRCFVDNNQHIDTSTHSNDDSFNTIEDYQPSNGEILHTVVNNEVVTLNWVKPAFKLSGQFPETGMDIQFIMQDLKSSCGISSYGYIVLAPKYKKPRQLSKKYCIAYKVEKGEAIVTMPEKRMLVHTGGMFYIPLGVEYAIINPKETHLHLFFHKIAPQ